MKYLLCIILCIPQIAMSLTFDLPRNGDNVVGEIMSARAKDGERLIDIGRRFDIGYFEMKEANPEWTFSERLRQGTRVVIPAKFILPPVARRGIVINLAEMRLYYYPKGANKVVTLPVGIGRQGWDTPLGKTYVASKIKDPVWRPTKNVKADAKKHGIELPDYWPAGPDNPLGQYAMRLGWGSYLIHGTNDPNGVGRRSSAGCIRMFPEDIEELFAMVPVRTSVRVVNYATKLGKRYGKLYIESHIASQDKGKYVRSNQVEIIKSLHQLAEKNKVIYNWQVIDDSMKHQNGLPSVYAVETKHVAVTQ